MRNLNRTLYCTNDLLPIETLAGAPQAFGSRTKCEPDSTPIRSIRCTVPFLFLEVREIFPHSSLKSAPRSSVESSELVGAVSVHTMAVSDGNQAPALMSVDRRVSVFYGSLDRYHHVTMSID
jgi:hypothetical protein